MVAPLLPQPVQRAPARNSSLEASGPHRMTAQRKQAARDAGSARTTATPKVSLDVAHLELAVVLLRAWRNSAAIGRFVKQRYRLSVTGQRSTYK